MVSWYKCAGYFSENVQHHGPYWLSVEQGKITSLQNEPPEESIEVMYDDSDYYFLPLLSDTHVHVYMNPYPLNPKERVSPGSKTFDEEVEDAINRTSIALKKGIGFLRDMGDPHGINLAVREHIKTSPSNFPELQVPGPALHRPKKYGRFLGVCCETMQDVKNKIDSLVEEDQVDYIKIVSTGIVNFSEQVVKQSPQYTIEELAEIVEYAASKGKKVASHCSGSDGVDINIAANVPFIEHAYFIEPHQQERILEQGLCWTPTIAPVYQQGANEECGWDAEDRRSIFELVTRHNQMIASGQKLGMRILAGTDAGCPGVEIGDGLFLELKLMASSMPIEEVLRIATKENADACETSNYTGRIQQGGPASFSIFKKPPWLDLEVLSESHAVIHHGKKTS